MMDDSAVFAVRAKYADDLEELVQCPVCFERPSGVVPTCLQGHHLCRLCRDSLFDCPICRSGFTDARNFVVEELSSKLKDILSSLLEPNPIVMPPPPPPRKVTKSTGTQTDIDTTTQELDESLMIVDEYLVKGCRIGFCQAHLPAKCGYLHVRDYHRANLIKVKLEMSYESDDSLSDDIGPSFTHRFSLAYALDKLLDYALYAEGLGMFFLSLHVDHEGNMQLELHIADSHQNNELKYEIDVSVPQKYGNRRELRTFMGKVQPCLASTKKFANAHKCGKAIFAYYFEDDGKILSERRTATFDVELVIERTNFIIM